MRRRGPNKHTRRCRGKRWRWSCHGLFHTAKRVPASGTRSGELTTQELSADVPFLQSRFPNWCEGSQFIYPDEKEAIALHFATKVESVDRNSAVEAE